MEDPIVTAQRNAILEQRQQMEAQQAQQQQVLEEMQRQTQIMREQLQQQQFEYNQRLVR
nr:hypothetical protein [Cupriavidus taiwanensis]